MGTDELGLWLGVIVALGGTGGVLLGGAVSGRWLAHDEQAQLRVCSAAVALLMPALVTFLLVPGKGEALLALVPLAMAMNFFFGPVFALMQRLVPDGMRATLLAVVLLLANLIGMGIGPQIVGIVSDALMPSFGDDSLRWAMIIMSLACLWAAYHFWAAGRTVREDLAVFARNDVPVFEAAP
jgi:hypothetical protein